MSVLKYKKSIFYIVLPTLLLALAWIAYELAIYSYNSNPLPKDEVLIKHFYKHRSEFDEIVRRCREFSDEKYTCEHPVWLEQDNTRAILHSIEVKRVMVQAYYWVPKKYNETPYENMQRTVSLLRQDIHNIDRYASLEFFMEDRKYDDLLLTRMYSLKKTLVHFPQAPLIKQSRIIMPWASEEKQLETKNPISFVILPSLNDYIPRKGFCVLRQIDSQWFISMCGQ